jgi:hypothetical protein
VDVVAKYVERLTRDYVDAGHGSDEPGEQGMVDR